MATYKILFWQEVPSQIKVDDGADEITVPMPPRCLERIDLLAARRKLQSADDYLAQWKWSEEAERDGSAEEVAASLMEELEARADW